MLEFSVEALIDADILIYVTDVVETIGKNHSYIDKVARMDIPVLLVLNKIDLLKGDADLNEHITKWKEMLPKAEIFPISAQEDFNVSNLMQRIISLLPDSPPFSERRINRQAGSIFRYRNRQRKDFARLRQGNTLFDTGNSRKI